MIIETAAQHIRQTENQLRFIYNRVPGGASYKMSMMQTEFQQRFVLDLGKYIFQGEHHTNWCKCMLQGEHDANACFRESMVQLDNMFSRQS